MFLSRLEKYPTRSERVLFEFETNRTFARTLDVCTGRYALLLQLAYAITADDEETDAADPMQRYYVNEGYSGSFCRIHHDQAIMEPSLLDVCHSSFITFCC